MRVDNVADERPSQLQRLAQRVLMAMGDRFHLFLLQGIHARPKINHRLFMDGTFWLTSLDYVRNTTAELLSREIHERNIAGAVAEVGVYQANFAALLNHHFPDRTLYLFDTFEGFDPRDIHIDRVQGWTSNPQDFDGTSIATVMGKLPYPHMVKIRAGWFPESAKGSEDETFCLVSIDVDLYQPILAALRWFYPRLSPGGYLLVHDYNNDEYMGVKHALRQFGEETGVTWSLLPDRRGSAIITKGSANPTQSRRDVGDD
ncbi:MAG: TylF/MycF family methyltransferase [Actinomycetota bacterium]|nr:TylF/MycF family methyltransferase [Actinomycetota bacterium]